MPERKITEVDRLRIENIQLRMEKIQAELQLVQMSVQQKLSQRDFLVQEMGRLQEEFLKKYDLDLRTAKIAEDGSY